MRARRLQFQHRDPLCGRKIPLEMQDSPLHKPHLWLENSRAWLCSYLHFWAARGTSPKSLESSLKTIRRMPARFLLYYFCSCYKSRKQSLKNPTKATSKAGKHHLSFPTLDISICKYKSGTAVEKVTLYTESKHMTCTWIVTIKEEGISNFISEFQLKVCSCLAMLQMVLTWCQAGRYPRESMPLQVGLSTLRKGMSESP